MLRFSMLIVTAVCALAACGSAQTQPATQGATADLDRLRSRLQATYEAGDIKGMLKYLHPDVIVVFPDGKVLEGREELVEYMDRMLKGPSPVVKHYSAKPEVEERNLIGGEGSDAAVSRGHMNDRYELSDGTAFALNSVFTTTVVRTADGPADTGGWVVRDFHSSTDAFDNPVLGLAARRGAWYAGIGAGVAGVLAGGLIGWMVGRRGGRSRPQP